MVPDNAVRNIIVFEKFSMSDFVLGNILFLQNLFCRKQVPWEPILGDQSGQIEIATPGGLSRHSYLSFASKIFKIGQQMDFWQHFKILGHIDPIIP